jgi:uncharacterized membrane protein YoaK (UPF0700 family)
MAFMIMLSAFAIGLQYMTMLRLNLKGVTTTFVTSMVVNLACRSALPEKGPRDAPSMEPADGLPGTISLSDRTSLFLSPVWGAYFSGIVASAALATIDKAAAMSFLPHVLTVVLTVHLRGRMGPDAIAAS